MFSGCYCGVVSYISILFMRSRSSTSWQVSSAAIIMFLRGTSSGSFIFLSPFLTNEKICGRIGLFLLIRLYTYFFTDSILKYDTFGSQI